MLIDSRANRAHSISRSELGREERPWPFPSCRTYALAGWAGHSPVGRGASSFSRDCRLRALKPGRRNGCFAPLNAGLKPAIADEVGLAQLHDIESCNVI